MKKIISAKEAAEFVKDNSTLMVGGFLSCGAPDKLVDALVETNVSNLTLICNDTTYPDVDKGKLIDEKRVKKVIASHIGTNPISGQKMLNKEIEVEMLPMGTFVEKIRAYGAGLGGILTPTGIGTILEEGKKIIEVNGKNIFLKNLWGLMLPLYTEQKSINSAAFHISEQQETLIRQWQCRQTPSLFRRMKLLIVLIPMKL